MVKLTDDYLQQPELFAQAKINVPQYDQQKMVEQTDADPIWVHFGGGNLFRCFHAKIAQDLLNKGALTSGIIVAETYDDGVITQAYHPYANRMLQVIMKAPQNEMNLIASVAQSIYYNRDDPQGWDDLKAIFQRPSLQMVTMSITEKGYQLTDIHGALTAAAQTDIEEGPDSASTNMGAIARLLLARFQHGAYPLALVSTDNFSENGRRFQNGILTIATGWVKNGQAPQAFLTYLNDPTKITFPWSMIDRITPNPAENVAAQLTKAGFEDTTIIHTAKHTNIAPFGNTEETHYLVIEDAFPNGRPPLEEAGVILTDRETVNDADQMKVTACLNPLHTALAIFGSLLGYTSIAAEMTDPDLVALIKQLGYQEDLPVVKDPKIIDPRKFIDEVITKRLPNKNIPDTPQRIASDTSQKLAIRYGVTLSHYLAEKADLSQLKAIPLILAGWCRYLLALDDQGQPFEPSRDPLLAELQQGLVGLGFGADPVVIHQALQPILTNQQIFGHDLYQIGLGETVESLFQKMIAGPGAVKQTIKEVVEVG
ncbi:mannitol dehydrogenase family protein [Lapidilactobacillus luobeiensis]|uniref:mannitol dehydrogenase family protein n=1 Tax=Lapidilactobacillus luobeiensis TaxID=2950371 RepID=UPI0021C28C6E|nr:mannitol dehydrogenase family protein [Lapidilactobacillus luobeiensis]